MDYLSEHYLQYSPVPIESLIGPKADKDGQLSMLDVTGEKRDELAEYAAEDADVPWQLAEVLRPLLEGGGQAPAAEIRVGRVGVGEDAQGVAELARVGPGGDHPVAPCSGRVQPPVSAHACQEHAADLQIGGDGP